MEYIYIAWQDEKTREWLPVAKLEKNKNEYSLSYTRGAAKSPSFVGFGRMNDLSKTYSSNEIFPFFKNRILSKSRPDYLKYISWLGLEESIADDMQLLSISSGSRATDSYEIISPPQKNGKNLNLKFFIRGISHLSKSTIEEIKEIKKDSSLYLMHDYQNKFDNHAILLRTDDPKNLIGYIPKYYCKPIHKFINSGKNIKSKVLQNNNDAPLNMRILCSIEIENCSDLFNEFFDQEDNFKPWSEEEMQKNISNYLNLSLKFD